MRTRMAVTAALGILLLAAAAGAQQVEFNYNGRVNVQGVPFDGDGLFKFTLVSADGSVTYWANDGVTLDGSEPTSSVPAHVTQGFFSVNIGDTNTTDMAPLDASLFNDRDRVCLRVWFSDQINGFERLLPDRDVVNPALLGSQSFSKTDIYVNPSAGDDEYTGLDPARPKKTIQSAWDALPPMVRQDVKIHLADGIYREEVLLKGKSVIGNAKITIEGNTTTPTQVRVTGATEGSETSGTLATGFTIINQQSLIIKGLLVDYYTFRGFSILDQSNVEVRNCKVMHDLSGFGITNGSIVNAFDLEVGNGLVSGQGNGFGSAAFAVVNLNNCNVHHFKVGIGNMQSRFTVYGGTFSDSMNGVSVEYTGTVYFASSPSCVIRNNSAYGVYGATNGVIVNANYNTYSSNGTDIFTETGAQRFN